MRRDREFVKDALPLRVLRSFGAIFGAVLALAPLGSGAAPVTLNFASVTLPPGGCIDASAYLASFGITFIPVSLGATAQICSAAGAIQSFPDRLPIFSFWVFPLRTPMFRVTFFSRVRSHN